MRTQKHIQAHIDICHWNTSTLVNAGTKICIAQHTPKALLALSAHPCMILVMPCTVQCALLRTMHHMPPDTKMAVEVMNGGQVPKMLGTCCHPSGAHSIQHMMAGRRKIGKPLSQRGARALPLHSLQVQLAAEMTECGEISGTAFVAEDCVYCRQSLTMTA